MTWKQFRAGRKNESSPAEVVRSSQRITSAQGGRRSISSAVIKAGENDPAYTVAQELWIKCLRNRLFNRKALAASTVSDATSILSVFMGIQLIGYLGTLSRLRAMDCGKPEVKWGVYFKWNRSRRDGPLFLLQTCYCLLRSLFPLEKC